MRRLTYGMTLTGYFSLITVLLVWNAWLQPPAQLPRALVLIVLLAPLMFPLRGLLHGRAYTHAWAAFLALFYFVLGVASLSNPVSTLYGSLQVISSVLMFLGCIFYVRAMKSGRASIEQ